MENQRPPPGGTPGHIPGGTPDHIPGGTPDHVNAVIAALCGPMTTGEHLRAIAATLEQARGAGLPDDPGAMDRVKTATAHVDPVLRESALAALTADPGHYVNLLGMIRNVLDLAPLDGINQIYWSMQRQLFLMRVDPGRAPGFAGDALFPFYQSFVAEIARRLSIRPAPWRPPASPSPPAAAKAVIVTNQFLSLLHQPSRDLLEQATILQDRGVQVTILNTNMMPDRYYSPFVPPFAADIEAQLNGDQILSLNGRDFRIISSTEPGLAAAKLNRFMAAVEQIDPDVVIAIGGSVIVADLLAAARPCLCIQTTSGFTVSLARLILDFGGGTAPAGDHHYARAWRRFRLGLSLRDDPTPTSRREWGLPDDAFACIVVGNRLDHEADDSFLNMLDRILAAEPAAHVVFAGPVDALPARLATRPAAARMHCPGYVDKINGLLAICDVCLNPRRTGGGASAMQALAAGLPIVSLAAGDVASVAGADFCVADPDAFVNRVLELSRNPAARAQAQAAARARHAALAAEDAGHDQLFAYIEEAQKLFLS